MIPGCKTTATSSINVFTGVQKEAFKNLPDPASNKQGKHQWIDSYRLLTLLMNKGCEEKLLYAILALVVIFYSDVEEEKDSATRIIQCFANIQTMNQLSGFDNQTH